MRRRLSQQRQPSCPQRDSSRQYSWPAQTARHVAGKSHVAGKIQGPAETMPARRDYYLLSLYFVSCIAQNRQNTCQENALCSDGMLALLAVTAPLAMVLPKVSAPPNFVQPTPRPLTVTRPSEELPSLLTGGLVLAIRLATGVFTLGWSPKLLTGDEAAAVGTATGTYGFRFGPLAFRDTSPLLAGAPRPEQPLVLYEYEGSPFCRKVREAALLLDVPVEFRPCPGARAGFAAELKERTGRMTVRCASQARRGDWAYPTPWPSP